MKLFNLILLFNVFIVTNALSKESGTVSFGLRLGSEEEILFSKSSFNFTLENCKSLELCPQELTNDKFINALRDMNEYEIFKKLLEVHKDVLDVPLNVSSHTYSISKKGIVELQYNSYPRFFHRTDRQKLNIVVPVFIICFIVCLGMYIQKRKLLVEYNFKFSNLSIILIKYLIAKLFFSIIYLIQLVLFDDFEFKNLGSTGILITLSTINYMFSLATFILVTLFALGYCTLFFNLRNRKDVILKTTVLVVLYFAQTITKLLLELREIEHSYHEIFFKATGTHFTIGRIVVSIFIISSLAYCAYRTNKKHEIGDNRYKTSCFIILIGYIVSPLITFPRGGRNMLEFLNEKFASNTRSWIGGERTGIHIPEIIELIVILALIYIWRDQKYVEKDEKEYAAL